MKISSFSLNCVLGFDARSELREIASTFDAEECKTLYIAGDIEKMGCRHFDKFIQHGCLEDIVRGPCAANHQKWAFDANSRLCKQFRFGGCAGTNNNFLREDECERKCKPDWDIILSAGIVSSELAQEMKSVVTERSAVVASKMVEPSFGRNEFAVELGTAKSQPSGCDSPGMNIYIKNILCGNIH